MVIVLTDVNTLLQKNVLNVKQWCAGKNSGWRS
jgi:hypothetical protein